MAIDRSIEPNKRFALLILLAVKRALKRQFHVYNLSHTLNHLLRFCPDAAQTWMSYGQPRETACACSYGARQV
jgi:hypothetical protein